MKKVFLALSLIGLTFGIFSFRNINTQGFQAAPTNANGPSGGQRDRKSVV
jgi:hypothetical protein